VVTLFVLLLSCACTLCEKKQQRRNNKNIKDNYIMDYMFEAGFLGMRAPFFMDMVTFIVALLPLLLSSAIWLAKTGHHKAHKIAQIALFTISVIVVGYFEYGVRIGGGFDEFVKGSSLSHSFVFFFLIFHIAIAVITLFIWIKTLGFAIKAYSYNKLPGSESASHMKMAKQTVLWINATAITGIGVYLLLFVF
jgi:putative membrane protein